MIPDEKKETVINSGILEFSIKSYKEVSTDQITLRCKISKGLLFHYFGSKRNFYLYCLEVSLIRLLEETKEPEAGSFYDIIFSVLHEKFQLCKRYEDETRLVNMAARENCEEVAEGKLQIFEHYMKKTRMESYQNMTMAARSLPLKHPQDQQVIKALLLYSSAIMNQYLEQYKERPDLFFEKEEEIKKEIKGYMDQMLYGIVKEEEK